MTRKCLRKTLALLCFFLCFPIAPTFSQSAPVSTYQFGVIPPEPTPVIPPGNDIILYIHGGPGSRLEEASDLANPLLAAGLAKGKRYTIISFDQPSQGYSSMRNPTSLVPDQVITGDYYPLVAASEEFIVALVKALKIENRNIYVIGGSTGGALALRMGHRADLPWVKRIVAWNPASVWTTYATDRLQSEGLKRIALDTGFGRANEPEEVNSREAYFTNVFGMMQKLDFPLPSPIPIPTPFGPVVVPALFDLTVQPNPEEWYRGDRDYYNHEGTQMPPRSEWSCKWSYIGAARLEQQEVYNEHGRRWHWRLGTELLLFSFSNDKWAGPANTACTGSSGLCGHLGSGPANYLGIVKPTLLVASDDDDWNEGAAKVQIIDKSVSVTVPFHWENRWSRTREMAALMLNTPLSTLWLPNTGHSIHNERPRLFADEIVRFFSGDALIATFDPNMADEVCQPQLPQPSQPPQPSLFASIPAQLLDNPGCTPDGRCWVMEPAHLGGTFSNGASAGTYSLRLKQELRTVAQAVPQAAAVNGQANALANTLAHAAVSYYNGDKVFGNAFADLAVTGRDAYNAFRNQAPAEKGIVAAAETLDLSTWKAIGSHILKPPIDEAKLLSAAHQALDRAYEVAWALRNPNPDAAYQFRGTLGWIAVSGEDDPPARPVNVPSGIPIFGKDGKTQVSTYPQYELQIAVCPNFTAAPYVPRQCEPSAQGSVPFQIRYTVAGLPEITDVSPTFIPAGTATATPVKISGANFVDIKSVSPSTNFSFTVDSPTQITLNVPGNFPLGVYLIQVSSGAGYVSRTINLTVGPVVTGISPSNGPITGGTPVTVTGIGFNPTAGATNFLFGQAKGTLPACNSGEQCITYSPQGTGIVDVQASVQPTPGSSSALSLVNAADKFSYSSNAVPIEFQLPNAFFGIQSASVFLNGVAPQPNAGVALTSSDPNPQCQPPLPPVVCIQPSVLIPEGANSIGFPLEFRPISSKQDVTLTASYGGGSASAIAHLVPWHPLTVMADWANLNSTRGLSTIVVTIFLNAFAPTGGAAVKLSSKPSVFPDRTVSINGSYWTTVTIPVASSMDTTTSVTITATHNDASASTSMVFLCRPKRPCRKGTYWNNQDCQCEAGTIPQ